MRPRATDRVVHWLDHLAGLVTRRRLFSAGWGDEDVLARVPLIAQFAHPAPVLEITWGPTRRDGRVDVTDGVFPAPLAGLPHAARRAVLRRMAPAERGKRRPPVYIVLAASGDEGFVGRTRLWRPLVERSGMEILLLENPMYGARRPEGQVGTAIRSVSDHLLMNIATVEETRALVEHLHRNGYDRVGLAGFSMGGSSAALASAVAARPVATAVFAAGQSVVPVFTEGLLSRGVELAALGGDSARHRLAALFGAADLDRHPPPQRLDAAVIVGAKRDGYVFAEQVAALHSLWPASELRWLDTGHAGARVYHGEALRRAAVDAMSRLSS